MGSMSNLTHDHLTHLICLATSKKSTCFTIFTWEKKKKIQLKFKWLHFVQHSFRLLLDYYKCILSIEKSNENIELFSTKSYYFVFITQSISFQLNYNVEFGNKIFFFFGIRIHLLKKIWTWFAWEKLKNLGLKFFK